MWYEIALKRGHITAKNVNNVKGRLKKIKNYSIGGQHSYKKYKILTNKSSQIKRDFWC